MDNMQTFEEFLASTTANIPIISFFVNIVLTALLAFALKWIYVNYGMTLSNRRLFAKTFILTLAYPSVIALELLICLFL